MLLLAHAVCFCWPMLLSAGRAVCFCWPMLLSAGRAVCFVGPCYLVLAVLCAAVCLLAHAT